MLSKVVQSFKVEKDGPGRYVTIYTHSVQVDGQRYEVSAKVADGTHTMPIEYVDRNLRRQLVAAIEARIYGESK